MGNERDHAQNTTQSAVPNSVEPFADISGYVGHRRVPRRPVSCRIGVLIGGSYHLANAYEMGENGMMIDSPIELSEKQLIVVAIRVVNVVQGVMLSRVVYKVPANEPGQPIKYGLQFEQIGFDVKRMIRNFVASNRSSENVVDRNEIKAG